MQGFGKNFDNWCQLKVHHFAKIHLARQFGVTTVEVSTTRGTTALGYCLINNSYIQVLYKGGGVHPNWFDGQ
jgi:hypothetical protein